MDLMLDENPKRERHHCTPQFMEEGWTSWSFLVDSKAELNVEGMSGKTPLHVAASNGSKRTALCADLKAKNNAGRTALDLLKSRLPHEKSDSNKKLVSCLDWNMPTPET
ncbi:hypothetical protein MMC31_005410 [Peltigera leucophlebia]|nr:hypothetical protein [Peltigera leucophlebia]